MCQHCPALYVESVRGSIPGTKGEAVGSGPPSVPLNFSLGLPEKGQLPRNHRASHPRTCKVLSPQLLGSASNPGKNWEREKTKQDRTKNKKGERKAQKSRKEKGQMAPGRCSILF